MAFEQIALASVLNKQEEMYFFIDVDLFPLKFQPLNCRAKRGKRKRKDVVDLNLIYTVY